MEPQEEPQYAPSDVIAVLDRLTEMIEAGRSVPFSASVMINQAEGVELLDNARAALPADLVNADRIVADANKVLDAADEEAEQTISDARAEAKDFMDQSDQYVNQALSQLEELLGAIAEQTRSGRAQFSRQERPQF